MMIASPAARRSCGHISRQPSLFQFVRVPVLLCYAMLCYMLSIEAPTHTRDEATGDRMLLPVQAWARPSRQTFINAGRGSNTLYCMDMAMNMNMAMNMVMHRLDSTQLNATVWRRPPRVSRLEMKPTTNYELIPAHKSLS
jgi:hypothetical protein